MLGVIRTTIRSVGHEDRLSTIDHLDELRTRMIVSLSVVAVAFGLCFWQNHAILRVIDRPLAHQTQAQVRKGEGPLGGTYVVQRSARDIAVQLRRTVAIIHPSSASAASALNAVVDSLSRDIERLSAPPQGDRPVTLGIGEPFTTTVTLALMFALILALPVVLFQVYAFLMPALEPAQRRHVRPLLTAVPLLFITGVLFGYFVVLPAAVRFLLNFNSAQFNVLVQASQYYSFAATILLAMGVLFQVPVGIMAVVRAGIVTPRQLRRNRRYAVLACGALAAFLPGDVITLLLETVPLYLLFELGVLLASLSVRRTRARELAAVQE
jgi:sec-independent protein translocase protein TatC